MCCTTVTSSGILFEVDTRLRPNGEAGLMMTSLTAFTAYQMQQGSNTAWVWEHQALTRARFCAGNGSVRDRFEAIRSKVLCMKREPSELRQSIIDMRLKIHEGHPNRSENFDLKHDNGGMVDIEFMIQYIVLCFAHEFSALQANVGNIALLNIAANLGILSPDSAKGVSNAYRLFRQKQHQLRLEGHTVARVNHEDFSSLLANAQDQVKQLWLKLMISA
jgi:glutamate-ammonia-ligase adenylyltransferase